MKHQSKYDGQRLSAQQVKQFYHAGERDFRGAILRGCNFQGTDLTGADFSNTDIHGANFAQANLSNSKFIGAKAGITRKYQLLKIFLILVASYISLLFIVGPWLLIAGNALNPDPNNVLELSGFIFLDVVYAVLAILLYLGYIVLAKRRGFLEATKTTSVGGPILAVVLATITVQFIRKKIALSTFMVASGIFMWSLLSMIIIAIGVVISAIAIASMVVIAGDLSVFLVAILGVSTQLLWHIKGRHLTIEVDGVAFILGMTSIWLSYKIQKTAFSDIHRFQFIREFAINFVAWRGTRFAQANLLNADFESANLAKSQFRTAYLRRACFHLAKNLHYAQLEGTLLANPMVRELVVSLRGRSRSFAGFNLQGAWLVGADLSNCDFTEADLSHATVAKAMLTGVNLTQAQVLDTDFSQAELTGITIEGWNTNSRTRLDGVICDYVYLLNGQRERRPNSGNFQPGEFTQVFQEVLDTIDLIFQDGIDWKAFARTFAQVQVQYEDIELSVQSIENKGEGVVVVKLSAPPGTDKAAVHQSFSVCYQTALQEAEARYKAQLEAKEEQIMVYRQQNADMHEIVKMLANRPVTVDVKAIAESKSMQGNDNSRNISIGGDFNPSGSNININLGEISGQVSNEINQLPDAPVSQEQPGLKELLTQLKEAVEQDMELTADEKAEALGEGAKLAKAGNDPKEGAMQRMAGRAQATLKAISESLTDASTLATACKTLLPMIAVLF